MGKKIPYFVLVLFIFAGALEGGAGDSARSFRLHRKPGEQIFDYRRQLYQVGPGDFLRFSNGKSFEVLKIRGEGGNTRVFSVKDAESAKVLAIRLPNDIYDGYGDNLTGFTSEYLSSFVNGQTVYRHAGLPVVQVVSDQSYKKEYVAVEDLDIQFTLEDVLSASSDIPLEKRKQALGGPLESFAKSLWNFDQVGDCRPANIGWVHDRWVLFDMTDEFKLYQGGQKGSYDLLGIENFARYGKVAKHPQIDSFKYAERVFQVVQEQRAKHSYQPGLLPSDPVVAESRIRREYRLLVNEREFSERSRPTDEINRRIQHLRKSLVALKRHCADRFKEIAE